VKETQGVSLSGMLWDSNEAMAMKHFWSWNGLCYIHCHHFSCVYVIIIEYMDALMVDQQVNLGLT
jgi:hypothetical protein